MKLKQNGGLLLQQLSDHRESVETKFLERRNQKRPRTIMIMSMAKEVLEQFTKQFYQIIRWSPSKSPKFVAKAFAKQNIR